MTGDAEPTHSGAILDVPVHMLVVLGFLAAEGTKTAPLLGPGAPADLTEHLNDHSLAEPELIVAAKAAQKLENGPLIVLSAAAEATIRAVLDEPEIARGRLLIAGTGAAEDRAALEALPWLSWTRVRHVDLEYVPPRAVQGPVGGLEGGLGLVVLDADAAEWVARTPHFAPMARILPQLTSAWLPDRFSTAELEAGRHAQATVVAITSSASWRITAPLRAAKRALRREP
jgi:hypothetical protein